MSIDLKFRDFFHPVSILKLRRFLEKSQWFSEEELEGYQLNRLRLIISHAYENVPYYRNLFDEIRFNPQDVESLDDLKKLIAVGNLVCFYEDEEEKIYFIQNFVYKEKK